MEARVREGAASTLTRDKHGSVVDAARGIVVEVHVALLSRLLYANPVCLLSTHSNLMTLSWLTALDNHGHFVCSVNKARHSASLLRAEFERHQEAHFVLNIPTSALAESVLKVGACHGDKLDKWQSVGLTKCALDWTPWPAASATSPLPADSLSPSASAEPVPSVLECVAHLRCVVTRMDDTWCDGHWLLGARIVAAAVKQAYWSGTQFVPAHVALAPPLSFLGSQCFAAVTPFALVAPGSTDNGMMSSDNKEERTNRQEEKDMTQS